jgi:hypothetical protein
MVHAQAFTLRGGFLFAVPASAGRIPPEGGTTNGDGACASLHVARDASSKLACDAPYQRSVKNVAFARRSCHRRVALHRCTPAACFAFFICCTSDRLVHRR